MKSSRETDSGSEFADLGDDGVALKAPKLFSEITSDYASTGLSLRPHIMSLLRDQRPFNDCTPAVNLAAISSGRFVRIAGLVTGRQRPSTAKGTVFLTLEDETGNISVVVWVKVQENFRQQLITAKLLLIKGRVETEQSVTHVIAGSLEDCSAEIETLAVKSRDFH